MRRHLAKDTVEYLRVTECEMEPEEYLYLIILLQMGARSAA